MRKMSNKSLHKVGLLPADFEDLVYLEWRGLFNKLEQNNIVQILVISYKVFVHHISEILTFK